MGRARLFLFVCFSWIVDRFCLISGSYGSTIGAPLEHYRGNSGARAHPDLNQGPADLQSAALAIELCTHAMRG